ncbi:helix-turn-helix transcriptional regulator [Gemmata sp. JC717]|uniref:PadR family transcriptional regulator n=1 Tax=Gemmata algarum TaxID=2975278 RepID=UPI0021BA93A6|nr:helix-turn-helix transcriptional regulator [Gemmata algarum]MDY3554037.1 helix-turn-helix transcriptional regulator [Gemmata algarum]
MSKAKAPNPDFLNGVPELLVLRLLSRRPMHGYGVVRAIKDASGAQFDFGEGCIYPILHRLERSGLLAAVRERVGNRTRIVYTVTADGLARLERSASSWAQVVAAVNRVLQGGTDGEPSVA